MTTTGRAPRLAAGRRSRCQPSGRSAGSSNVARQQAHRRPDGDAGSGRPAELAPRRAVLGLTSPAPTHRRHVHEDASPGCPRHDTGGHQPPESSSRPAGSRAPRLGAAATPSAASTAVTVGSTPGVLAAPVLVLGRDAVGAASWASAAQRRRSRPTSFTAREVASPARGAQASRSKAPAVGRQVAPPARIHPAGAHDPPRSAVGDSRAAQPPAEVGDVAVGLDVVAAPAGRHDVVPGVRPPRLRGTTWSRLVAGASQ